jgi:MarR family transcriptional regulator, transcriptional regulator for hemolysin
MVARTTRFENSLGFILSDISRLARKEFDRRVRDLRVTRAQWLVLIHLARRPGCTQSDLADAMQMQKITVTRHVERLLRAGWVERQDHVEDRRAYHLYLSRKAEPLIDRLTAIADQMRGEFMRGLSATRRDALITDLLHIKDNLLRMDAQSRRNGENEKE